MSHFQATPTRTTRVCRDRHKIAGHKLPACAATGLDRYRDRHQARDGAKALAAGAQNYEVSTFACPDCRGYHVEPTYARNLICVGGDAEPVAVFTESLSTRKRRYFLVDIENPTLGAKASREEVAMLWNLLKQQAPGIAPHDHVVVGAARRVARRYREAIHGANVKWVVGADAPDGADRALLAAIDLRRVARDYDELVIISGDHAFADLARQAKAMGLSVHVVTVEHPERRSMLSRELAAAANTRSRVRLESRVPQHATVSPITVAPARKHRRVHFQAVAA